jgi:DNA-directed RNA polymerase specialized sigma24 family protein
MAHKGPIPDGLEINHKNGVRDDNRLSNLEVVTRAENIFHRKTVLKPQGVRGEANNLAKLTNDQAQKILDLKQSGLSATEIAKLFDVTRSTVSLIHAGKTWPSLRR